MKTRELKQLIKGAYSITPSEKKTAFIQKYQLRELNYLQIICIQLQYMGGQFALLGGCVLTLLLGTVSTVGKDLTHLIAAIVPVAALIAITGLGRSARYGMDELEMSSRFSLRMLRTVRLAIIGIADFLIMLSISGLLKILTGAKLLHAFAFTAVPYLFTTFLCMVLIRRWHSPKNIYGCIVVAVGTAAMVLVGMNYLTLCTTLLYTALPVLFLLTVMEAFAYIKESEELQWNLC